MRTSQAVYWFMCFLVFAGALTLVGCDRASVKWSEEVRLADGRMIVVARTAQGRTYSELGGTGGWRDPVEMSIAITKAPGDIKLPPEWRDTYVPVLLDYDESDKSWSIVTTFYLNRPGFSRHLQVVHYGNHGGVYERQAVFG